MSLTDYWPLFGLRITTPRLELRIPSDDDFVELIDLAKAGIHDPATTPFASEWTDVESPEFERRSLQFWWKTRSNISPAEWHLNFVVLVDGRPVGSQGIWAVDFPVLRRAETGSWLGLDHQGQGIGKEMRRAVLHLAFEHLGALEVISSAFEDNPASQGVSLAVGYEPNGAKSTLRRGQRAEEVKFRLTHQRWETVRPDFKITVEGFEPCRAMLGLD